MTLEVERFHQELLRVRQEHGQVENECRRILQTAEHNSDSSTGNF